MSLMYIGMCVFSVVNTADSFTDLHDYVCILYMYSTVMCDGVFGSMLFLLNCKSAPKQAVLVNSAFFFFFFLSGHCNNYFVVVLVRSTDGNVGLVANSVNTIATTLLGHFTSEAF